MSEIKITVLGSGTSQGVPVIACDCSVCQSLDPKDNRLRSSIMVSYDNKNYVIDSGPDFRQQMLREKVQTLEAVVFTHEHKDHVAGLDDVRAFNFKENKDMKVYCSDLVEIALKREFHYVFRAFTYPGIPKIDLNIIDKSPFLLGAKTWTPIEVFHHKLSVLGFRIGDFTYITDAKTISDEEKDKARNSKVLIINALRHEEHISHFNLDEALAMIEELQPEKAYLTHISHYLGKNEELKSKLPKNVELAYDGLVFTV
ncbi:MAG: phosphoribosyl 1,2-cyclic phosphate phosphodiesterase [Lentimonas sp.]|jgi:phosphoribosyl 1,2-cyclic phosphate phosphodiesterase